ncbi:lytic murein transglycosylase [Pseudomonas sp. M30-35]|uniref:lytic murein transglycosylase n=1 Tax=Pseudomonas sp. M30-35 TaxID=1981174 RepID=UPI000B3CFE3C|nr:lytic transglycosylase [Pseudomonas sp. M30-35]
MNKTITGIGALLLATGALATQAEAASFQQCLSGLRGKALAKGVSGATFDRYTQTLEPDMSVLELLNSQPEFSTPIWDYLAALVDQQRVDEGRQMLKQHADTLAKVSRTYGVDPATVVAVWGVESDYGKTFGKRPLLTSLSTLSCYGRRQAFFQGEFFATLKLLQSGDIQAQELKGSWAGAFGHTQFMPSTYQRIAVDGDGDGRRDLVASIPDALASTANYLKRSGWRTGQPWGYEVKLPAGFNTSSTGRKNKRALKDWVARGVVKVDGSAITPSDTQAGILLPAGAKGPAFIVMRNFDAIYSYNAAESYALAIAHLSDRLRGGDEIATPWPTDDPGLSRIERKQLQELLLARGYDIGEADGLIGTNTRKAIVEEQKRLGLQPYDGRAGKKILKAMQAQ